MASTGAVKMAAPDVVAPGDLFNGIELYTVHVTVGT
jgi:hypothetical protein